MTYDRLIERSIDQLIHRSIYRLIDWWIGIFEGRFTELAEWFNLLVLFDLLAVIELVGLN